MNTMPIPMAMSMPVPMPMPTKVVNFVATVTVVVFAVFAIVKLKHFLDEEETKKNDFDRVRQFLLNGVGMGGGPNSSSSKDKSESRRNKIPIWIHLPYETNARNWDSFSERKNSNLNQPYINACIESILKHCSDDHNICIIDDTSFERLMPGIWKKIAIKIDHPNAFENFDLSTTPDPQRGNLRNLALLELVFKYGGIVIPPSYLCFRNLGVLLEDKDRPFIVENINRGGASQISAKTRMPNDLYNISMGFAPDINFFGCAGKNNNTMGEWIESSYVHFTAYGLTSQELQFSQTISQWCVQAVKKRKMSLVAADQVCSAYRDQITEQMKPILVDTLFDSSDKVMLSKHALGVFIPAQEMLARSKYNWFCSISVEEILKGDYLLASMFRHSASLENGI